MDYDAILKKMNLLYFEGKLQNSTQSLTHQIHPNQPNQPNQPTQPKMTREQYIQSQKQRLNEKRRIQQEQFQKRKLLLSTNITTTSSLKQMNISKFG
jgi:hypothetical protein